MARRRSFNLFHGRLGLSDKVHGSNTSDIIDRG
jgi:hypothetical protein